MLQVVPQPLKPEFPRLNTHKHKHKPQPTTYKYYKLGCWGESFLIKLTRFAC